MFRYMYSVHTIPSFELLNYMKDFMLLAIKKQRHVHQFVYLYMCRHCTTLPSPPHTPHNTHTHTYVPHSHTRPPPHTHTEPHQVGPGSPDTGPAHTGRPLPSLCPLPSSTPPLRLRPP